MSTLTCEPIQPTTDPVTISDTGADTEYFELCKRIGLRNKIVVKHELERVLHGLGARAYSRESVQAFMDGLCAKENQALQEKWNAEREPVPAVVMNDTMVIYTDGTSAPLLPPSRGWSGMLTFGGPVVPARVHWGWQALRKQDMKSATIGGLYEHPVPYAVLLQAEQIVQAFPEARFLVAAYEAIKPDPFLMVTHKLLGTGGYIIERWNEPAFRE